MMGRTFFCMLLVLSAAADAAAQHVFVRGLDGRLWTKSNDGIAWSDWTPAEGLIRSAPDGCTRGETTPLITVVALDRDGAIVKRDGVAGSWSPWSSLGGRFLSPPAVVCSPAAMDVFGRGLNGALFHKRIAGGTETGWLELGGQLLGAPDAALGDGDNIFVVARGTDDTVMAIAFRDGVWSDWTPLHGGTRDDPAIASWRGPDGRSHVEVFVRGNDGHLWHASLAYLGRLAWRPLGLPLVGSPSAARVNGPGRRTDEAIDVVGRDIDGQPLFATMLRDGTFSQRWIPLQGQTDDDPGITEGNSAAATSSGRYRITLAGFVVESSTFDHPLQTDGKGDEVVIEAFVREVGGAGGASAIDYRRTRVIGDTHNLAGRIRGGSASPLGGLVRGDRVLPVAAGTPAPDALPLVVWEGELRDNGNGVLVVPTVWEVDDTQGALRATWRSQVDAWMAGVEARYVAEAHAQTAERPRATRAAGLRLARPIPGPLGGDEWRPIGMTRTGEEEQFQPHAILFTFKNVEYLLRGDVFEGVMGVRYRDAQPLGGDYEIRIRVERLQ